MKEIKQEKILLIPSKSRYELELEKWGNEEVTKTRFKSERVWQYVQESYYAQKENIKRVAQEFGYEKIIDRSLLTPEKIKENDLFVFLGGDNHFIYCAQEILKYLKENPGEKKYVLGSVLDPSKSIGALLYFNVDTLLESLPKLEEGNYFIESWATLEAKVKNENGLEYPYPAVGDYFVGERERLLMSRNKVFLDGMEIGPDKSSGILIATGAGSGEGSWYNNIHRCYFGEGNEIEREEEYTNFIFTEHKSKTTGILYRGQTLVIDSYNDDKGVVSPDSHREHSVDFDIGYQAEIWISDLKLKVVRIE